MGIQQVYSNPPNNKQQEGDGILNHEILSVYVGYLFCKMCSKKYVQLISENKIFCAAWTVHYLYIKMKNIKVDMD